VVTMCRWDSLLDSSFGLAPGKLNLKVEL